MILADTSAWVEYDRSTGSGVDRRMVALIQDEGPLAVTEPVVMELVAGARTDEREAQLRRLLLRFELLEFDGTVDFDGATKVYRCCRQVGITPRGLIDCMVATVALRYRATLLAADADLIRVARVMGIDLDAG
ncbi:MAG: type II toxin-antitoxin system VapC family toxin [Acidimicrobiales bacterium]